MKAPLKPNRLKAILAFLILSVFAVSCSKDPLPEPDPIPVVYVAPAVVIKAAENVTMTTATIVAKVVANNSPTTVTLECMELGTSWGTVLTQTIPAGTDSVTISSGLLYLKKNTVYTFRAKASNKSKDGAVTSSESSFETGAVSDFDGNVYHINTIGTQTWIRENFRGTHYANGDPIPNVNDATTWANLTTGAYCWYNKDANLGKTYGGLYNFYVGTHELIVGYHTPTDVEWRKLRDYLDNPLPSGWVNGLVAGPKVMETGNSHWQATHLTATNSSGFTALPNGIFAGNNGDTFTFMNLGEDAMFWSTIIYGSAGWSAGIDKNSCIFALGVGYNKNFGFGLRLTKN